MSRTIVELKCEQCKVTFSRDRNQTASVKGYKNSFCSRGCATLYNFSKLYRGRDLDKGIHGTKVSYRYCKCSLCKAANTEAMREYRASKSDQYDSLLLKPLTF